jgi:DNA processing protein
MNEQGVAILALKKVPGLGDKNIKQLVSYCGGARQVFDTPKGRLAAIPGMGPKTLHTLQTHTTLKAAEEDYHAAEQLGINILTYLDAHYPRKLKSVEDAPCILYSRGSGDLNPKRSIGIVGTRRATPYGREICRRIVEELKTFDVQIISGLAYGIDIAAHKAAIDLDMSTIAILAGGLDTIYPSAHRKYAEALQKQGAIVSESAPGTAADAHLFPARNRIIAGMSDAIIIVEAADKGGALITATQADSYNRPLFAVPGNLTSEFSKGTNALIDKQMALIYTSVRSVVEQLNWGSGSTEKKIEPSPSEADLSPQERLLVRLIRENGAPLAIDALAMRSQIPINQLASILLSLEFKGLIRNLPGSKYGLV